eukprot:scaffold8477_cov112-Isochrysis_galbana.AAC.14
MIHGTPARRVHNVEILFFTPRSDACLACLSGCSSLLGLGRWACRFTKPCGIVLFTPAQAMVSRAAASQWIADDWVELDESCPGEPQVNKARLGHRCAQRV